MRLIHVQHRIIRFKQLFILEKFRIHLNGEIYTVEVQIEIYRNQKES